MDTSVEAGTYRYKVVGYYKDIDKQWVYGDLSDTLYVTVEEDEPAIVFTEDAKEYAAGVASEYIATFLGLTTAGYAELNSQREFYLGDGYYTYLYNDNLLTKSSVICFPIIQNDTIVMLLYVSCAEGEWVCRGSVDLVDVLNQNYNNVYAIVYSDEKTYIVTNDDIICNGDFSVELDYDDVTSQLSQLEINAIGMYNVEEDGMTNLGYVENPLGDTMPLGYTPGFNVDEPTYKILEMANCLVDQNGPNGEYESLCWASSAVTIIRYRTGGYRNLQPYFVASVLGKSYEQGGNVTDVFAALKKYLNANALNHYTYSWYPASSIHEVHHNINNGFPISMGCLSDDSAHMVTLIGYNGNQLIYWDSQSLTLNSVAYNNIRRTRLDFGGVEYKWETSVLVPLS